LVRDSVPGDGQEPGAAAYFVNLLPDIAFRA
jgi:hypothetical protein